MLEFLLFFSMTRSEKIILRFYAANSFMYIHNNEKYHDREKVYKDIQKALEIEANINYSGI